MMRGALLFLCVGAVSASGQPIRVCAGDRTDPKLASALWTSIRGVLAASEEVHTRRLEPLVISRFERAMDLRGKVVSDAPVEGRRYGTHAFRVTSPAVLSREGYTTVDSLGNTEFRGPDAGVFLSEEFANEHCFGIAAGRGLNAGLTGLTFQPVASRHVAEIAGTFWGDADAALRFVEFTYRGAVKGETPGVGGRLIFEQLPSGNWIVRDWISRVPMVTQRGALLGFREEGGETMVVSGTILAIADSIQNARRPAGRINGVVLDSLTRRAFTGARVWVDSAGPQTRSNDDGAFSLRGVTPGLHLVSFSHPTLDSLGVRALRARVYVASDSTSNLLLAGPSFYALKGDACADTSAIATGSVRDVVTGASVAGAEVTVTWIEMEFSNSRLKRIEPRAVDLVTDANGRYALCVPAREDLTAVARVGTSHTGSVDFRADERSLALQSFTVDPNADSVAGSASVAGKVVYDDGTPIAGATVRLSEPVRSVLTDSGGRFRIANVPGGTRVLDARAIGHAPNRVVADLRPGAVTEVTVFLRKVTTMDAITVRAAANDRSSQLLAELEERRKNNDGFRLTQTELATFRSAGMDAVVRALPFVKVRAGRDASGLQITLGTHNCVPTLWLDGHRAELDVLYLIAANEVREAEVFLKETHVPTRFRGMNSCGAILVWTRG